MTTTATIAFFVVAVPLLSVDADAEAMILESNEIFKQYGDNWTKQQESTKGTLENVRQHLNSQKESE